MVDFLWRNGRTFRLVSRLGLLSQPQPGQRNIEHDGFVFGRLLALGLTNAIRGVLTIPCYADHHRPHHTCTRPKPVPIETGNCDQLQTKMRRQPKLPPQHCVIVGELADSIREGQLAWRTSGFCRRSRSRSSTPRLGRTPHMFDDAVRAEDAAAGDRRRTLAVEAGEDIMPGVLAPDNDPGHDLAPVSPHAFLVRHHNENGREPVPLKKARRRPGACDAVFVKAAIVLAAQWAGGAPRRVWAVTVAGRPGQCRPLVNRRCGRATFFVGLSNRAAGQVMARS